MFLDEDDLMDEIENLNPLLERNRSFFGPMKGKHVDGFVVTTLPNVGPMTIEEMVKDSNHLRSTGGAEPVCLASKP